MQINHNISAMVTQHSLYTSNNAMSKSLEKLSTGLRINRAQDDAAGLAMSEQMRSQIRGLGKAKQNSQDGICALQIAEGALGEITAMMQRQKELAVQAANDTLTSTERMYLNDEFEALTKEIKRVAETTDYNGKNVLLFDSDPNKSFGATKLNPYNEEIELMNASRVLYKAFGDNLTLGSLSVLSTTYASGSVASDANAIIIAINQLITDHVNSYGGVLDVNNTETLLVSIIGAGHTDIGGGVYLDGDKLFANTASYSGLAGAEKTVSNQQALKSANAFLKSAADALAALRAAKAGSADTKAGAALTVSYALNGIAGIGGGIFDSDIPNVTFTGISFVDSIVSKLAKDTTLVSLAGILGAGASAQMQRDLQSFMLLDTNKMAPSATRDKLVTLQKAVGLLQEAYKNYAERNYAVGTAASEILHVGANYSRGLGGPLANEIVVNYVAIDIKGLGLDAQAIDGQKAATRAIDRLDDVIKIVSGNRAAIGTYINRLEYTINNIASMIYNTQEAESRIRDTDFSKETTEFTKNQILVQSGTSILAQANSLPQMALTLLG